MRIVDEKNIPEGFFDPFEVEIPVSVIDIIKEVRLNGDSAVKRFTQEFDGVDIKDLRVPLSEIEDSVSKIPPELKKALESSTDNVKFFAQKQLESIKEFDCQPKPGVVAGQKLIPIKRVGIYAPGGRFPLPSSVIMGAIPAIAAGVDEVVLFSPPQKDGKVSPVILAAAELCGIKEVYSVGGAQAVAVMAYGTETIKDVDFIAGPGNKYVAAAKKLVYGRVGIDFIAGPSEVLIIADRSGNPDYIAADLLAQAEHDPDASSILLTTSKELAEQVSIKVEQMLKKLPTAFTAGPSIENNGLIVICSSIEKAVEISNRKAPEHLEIQVNDTWKVANSVNNFGALFVGKNTAEAIGDYIAGPNHTLPTNQAARYTGGLSVLNFLKVVTTLNVSQEGIKNIGKDAIILANSEGLQAHSKSIEKRSDISMRSF